MNRRSFIKSTGIASLGLGLKIDKTYSNNSLSNFPKGSQIAQGTLKIQRLCLRSACMRSHVTQNVER